MGCNNDSPQRTPHIPGGAQNSLHSGSREDFHAGKTCSTSDPGSGRGPRTRGICQDIQTDKAAKLEEGCPFMSEQSVMVS